MISLQNTKKLWTILFHPVHSTKLFILFIVSFLFIPSMTQVGQIVFHLQEDLEKITTQLPDFSVSENHLSLDNKKEDSFIYKSDYLTFVFDPLKKVAKEDVHLEASPTRPAIALLPDELYVDFSYDQLGLPYESTFSKQKIIEAKENFKRNSIFLFFFIAIIFLVTHSLFILIVIFIMAQFAKLMFKLVTKRQLILSFQQSWQLATGIIIQPIFVYSIMSMLGFNYFHPLEFVFIFGGLTLMLTISDYMKHHTQPK